MRRLILCLVTTAVLLLGCETTLAPNQVRLTLDSSPPGAMIYEEGKAWGIAPIDVRFSGDNTAVQVGYAMSSKLFALWPSGAKSRPISIKVPIGQGNKKYTFSRPSDAPGLDKDLAYAAQLRQIKAAEQQSSAASAAAFWQMYNTSKPITTNCMTLGGVMTNCTSQ